MKGEMEFNAYALVTPKGALVRHMEGSSHAPMLFKTKIEATRMANRVQLGSEPVKLKIRLKRQEW